MHEYYKLREAVSLLLEAYGFIEGTTDSNIDIYGSMKTHFKSNEDQLMLTWDAKDGFGYAEIWERGSWDRLINVVFEPSDINYLESVDNLCLEIKSYY